MATRNIASYEDLVTLSETTAWWGDDIVLTANINASSSHYQNERVAEPGVYDGFQPIGTSETPFTGTFNGAGFKIVNLYINRDTEANIGFFGKINSAGTFQNVTLENIDFTGKVTGGFCGTNAGGNTFQDINVSGVIHEVSSHVGGFVSNTDAGTFVNCTANVQIDYNSTGDNVGGFAGRCNVGSSFVNCTASGSIITQEGSAYIGGFIGFVIANASASTFTDCLASVVITDESSNNSVTNYYGGFVGIVQSGLGAHTFEKCFSYNKIISLTTNTIYIGGFVGLAAGTSATYSKCGSECDIDAESASSLTAGGFVASAGGAISNCFAKGSVCEDGVSDADAYIGGFVGEMGANITNCYSVGKVTDESTNAHGFTGRRTAGTMTSCYFDKETSEHLTDGYSASAQTTTEMKTKSEFIDWNFDAIWRLPSFTRSPGSGVSVWLSESDDYENFEEGVNDADSFSVGLPTTNVVRWIESLKSLMLGTAGDEWKIGSNKLDTPISPTNFGAKQQTNYGGAQIQALKINEVILFVDFVKRKIYELTTGDLEGEYVGNDMASLAEHITDSGIVCTAHQKNPDSIVWCVLADGSLISMVYDRTQNVVAWSKHPIDGVVQSVAVIPATDEDEVWISVKRTIESEDRLYVEKFAPRNFGDQEDAHYVHSGIVQSSETPFTKVTGLSHLNGETVVILGDGAVLTSKVVQNGQIILDQPVSVAHVGLPYTYILQPMRMAPNSQEGSTWADKKHISSISVSFLRSLLAKFGTDLNDLLEIDWRTSEDYDSPPALFTGDKDLTMDGGFDVEAPIYISGNSPLPCTVRAIILRMDVSGR